MKPTKDAVALVIYNKKYSKILLVQRPEEDDLFPNAWSLPSGYLKRGESFEEAALRIGKDKLGVGLKILKFIGEKSIEKNDHLLHMKEYEAKIISGEPKVPQSIKGITQYQNLDWGLPRVLQRPARKGALCSQIFLASLGHKWR